MMISKSIVPIRKGKRRWKLVYPVISIIILLVFSLTTVMPASAAISTGSSTNASSGGANTVTIAKPSGTVAGDVLVACIMAATFYGDVNVTPPEGWQLIRTTNAYQSWCYDMVTYYKIAGASEPADYTWTSSDKCTSGGITRLTGVDINHVVDVSADNQGSGNTDLVTATAPSVTTNYANDVVINFFGSYASLADPYFIEGSYTPPLAPLYEWAPAYPGSGAYDPPSMAAYNWTMGSAGNTGARTCRLNKRTTTGGVWWVAQTIAFKAAPRAYFPVTSTSAEEADTSRWVQVNLAPGAAGPVEINFTVSGTAQPGTDYTMITTSPLTVNTGSGSASIGFNVLEDNLYEENETIIITLDGGSEYYLTGSTQYTYTITNDDLTAPSPVISAGASETGVSPVTGFPPESHLQVLQIQKPGGTVAGDFLLAAITRQGSSWSQTITPPTGWTPIRETYYSNSQGLKLATYYKIAGPSEPTIYTWGIPYDGSMSGYHASGGITRYTGVNLTQPIDVSNAASGTMPSGTTGNVSVPSVNPSNPNDKVIAVIGTFNPVNNITAPAAMTERYEIKHSISPYNSWSLLWPTTEMSDMTWAPATGTGVRSASVNMFVSGATDWIAQTIALKTSRLSINDVSIAEGNSGSTVATFTVSLDHPTNVPVTFNWSTADGTATAGNDYMVSGGTGYTIPAGHTSYTVGVPIIGDATLESNENFYVNITGVTGATVSDGQGTGTILNDDSSITINDVSQNEGNTGTTNFNFTVTLSPACSLPVSVTYFTPTEGTATQSTDYQYTIGTLNFAAGQTTKTISVPVIGDTAYEPNETFVVYLSSATNARITDNRGTGTIINDDVPPLPALSINDVSLEEGHSGDTNMVFTVALNSASLSTVTVDYATADGTATAGSDYTSTTGSLNIVAGQTTGTISVPVIGDTTYEPNETFHINLTNASGATISDAQGLGTILNDDAEGTAPTVSTNPTNQTIAYGANASFNSAANGTPSPTVQWQVSTDGGTSFSNISNGGVYSGATTTTLSLTQPPVSYSGYKYRAIFANGINPEATSGTATLTVTPLTITGGFTADNKVYDGMTDATVSGRSLTGVLPGDDVSLTGGTAAFDHKNAGTGKTVTLSGATLSGTDAGNYSLTSVATATADITAKAVTPSTVAHDKAYDGTTTATLSSQTVSGVIAPDNVTLLVGEANFDNKNVGTWTVTATTLSLGGTDAGNYTLSAVTATDTADITAINLTISGAVAQNKVYDGNNNATVDFSGASLAGAIGTDVVSIKSDGYSATFDNENVGNVKPVTVTGVTLSGADAANYTVTQPSGLTADITCLAITGSFTADNKVYDGTTAAAVLSRSLTGVLSGDVVSLTGGTAAFDDKNAGTGKTVTLSGATLSGTDAGNYTLTSVATATADITAKAVAPSIVANDKQYDGTTTATLISQTVSGVIAPDDVTLVVGKANFDDKNVGSWTVTATTLSLGGTDAGNYTLSAATATDTAAITAINLTISGAVAQNKVYDGNNTATVDFTGASLAGAIGTDEVSINSAGYSATFDNKNVGNSKPVTVAGVALSGTDAANYTVSQPSGLTADITALGITGSFTAENKVYDGTTAAAVLSRSLTGVLSGDVVNLTGGTAAFDEKNVGTDKTVTLSGATLSGANAGNYTLTSVDTATANITARAIEVSAVADIKVYDGTTSSDETPVITSVLGLATGDTAIWTQAFDTKDAGTNKTLTPTGVVNDGNGGANYNVTFVSVNTGVIEKATLTVTAENKSSQYSDPRLSFTATIGGFIPGETLATSGVIGAPAYTTSPVLSDPITQEPGSYTITPDRGSLEANNYDFNFVNGAYIVTKEDATIIFDSQNPVSVKVVSDNGDNDAFIWKVTISQAKDGNLGELSLINPSDIALSFSPVGGGSGWSGTASGFDPATGIASFNIPQNVLSVETYAATVSLNNGWFHASPAEDVLVVYDPSLGFTTGGGWFYWPAGTANPELEGAKTNFGFTMKYNKKGINVQGSFLLIAHLPDGSIIRMKSNAIYGLAIIDNTYPGIASFSGKCVYSRVDANGNILAEAGNQDFTIYVKDMNEPGTDTDMFWLTSKVTISGEYPFSLDINGNNKVDQSEYVPLGGGNIVVPHTASSGGGDTGENTPPGQGKKK